MSDVIAVISSAVITEEALRRFVLNAGGYGGTKIKGVYLEFVGEQRIYAEHPYTQLITPRETVYMVKNSVVAARLGLSANENSDNSSSGGYNHNV